MNITNIAFFQTSIQLTWQIIFLAAIPFLVSAAFNWLLIRYLREKGVLDIPNERSSHRVPTPRGGGLGIVAGVLFTSFLLPFLDFDAFLQDESSVKIASFWSDVTSFFYWILIPAILIAFIGWLDDYLSGLPAGLRFLLQTVLACVVIWRFGYISVFPFPDPLNWPLNAILGWAVSLIWIIGVTNIFNFLDGINGYSGTQAIIAGVAWAIISWGTPMAVPGLIIASAGFGFLIFNWGKAKIFMGDVGSAFLGFLFASLPFWYHIFPFENTGGYFFAMGVFLWFFLSDGVFTMIRRTMRGERFWKAHRSHLYQRLVINGWKHSHVVLLVISGYIVLLTGYFVLLNNGYSLTNWPTLILMICLFIGYYLVTTFIERKKHLAR